MGQNDSRHKNLPPGYQNYDPQMINNYLAYQQQLNPNFFMQGAYQTRVFPEGARLRQDSKTNQNSHMNASNFTKEKSHYGSESPNNSNAEKIYKNFLQPKNSMIQELLECPICMNMFDNPHVLPCQHTFCKGCIISLKNSDKTPSETICCPICRETHTFTNGLDSLVANYTMKKLIEMELIAAAEKEKIVEPKPLKEKKAKCLVCQKYAYLKVCKECSYMLCDDCVNDTNHEILIESRLNLKKRNALEKNFTTIVNSEKSVDIPTHEKKTKMSSFRSKILQREPEEDCIKLLLLVHSSEIENSNKYKKSFRQELFEDEHGKCSTFFKIKIFSDDRVNTLKKIVERKFGISCRNQVLVHEDRIMNNDSKFLFDFKLRQLDKIHIFDNRDIEDNIDEIEDELYGVYQEFSNISDNSIVINKNFRANSEHEMDFRESEISKYKDERVEQRLINGIEKNNSNYSRHFSNYEVHSMIGQRVNSGRPKKYESQVKYRNRD